MVILLKNVRTKAGLLPAGADVSDKLDDEVIADLIKSGLAKDTGKKKSADAAAEKDDGSEKQGDDTPSDDSSEQSDPDSADDVDLDLPDTSKKPAAKTTRTRSRSRKAK